MLRHGIGHSAVEHYFAGVAQLEFHVFEVGRCSGPSPGSPLQPTNAMTTAGTTADEPPPSI